MLTLILTAYFNATLGGVVVLFALHAIEELRNARVRKPYAAGKYTPGAWLRVNARA